MANSARGTEHATWVSASLTGIGIILIGLTLAYTRRTLDEARATAKAALASVDEARLATAAANRSADIQEEAFKRLERPYLFIEFTDFSLAQRAKFYFIECRIANHGRTPAILRSFYIRLAPSEAMEMQQNGMPVVENSRKRTRYDVIPANEALRPFDVRVDSAQEESWGEEAATRLHLHFIFTYEDPFGELYSEETLMKCNEGGESFQVVIRNVYRGIASASQA